MPSKRQTPRILIDLFANKFIGDEPFLCKTIDLSPEGAFLLKLIEPERSQMGEVIGIEFSLPQSEEVIWASGQVLREETKGGLEGYAVKFIAMADKHKKMIEDFIETQQTP